jgi:hypothetical protein
MQGFFDIIDGISLEYIVVLSEYPDRLQLRAVAKSFDDAGTRCFKLFKTGFIMSLDPTPLTW